MNDLVEKEEEMEQSSGMKQKIQRGWLQEKD